MSRVNQPALPAPSELPVPPRPPQRGRAGSERRRRTALTVEAIVAAAIAELDEAGLAGLSMRRVAERLGTGAASLYAHVSGRDELLELVFDELVGQVPLPEPDPARWREQVHELGQGLWQVLVDHRDAALAGLGRVPVSPKVMAAGEVLCTVLRAGGLPDRVVALGLDQLVLHVCAAAFESSIRARTEADPAELAAYFAEVHAYYQALPADRFPTLASLGDALVGYSEQDRFDFGIDVFIAGLEALGRAESIAGQVKSAES